MFRNNRGQMWTLIEVLVVVAIIVGVGLYLSRGYLGGGGETGVHTPKERAQSVDCINNLQQIRYAVTMHQQTSERSPGSLGELESGGIGKRMLRCPVSDTPYGYDPATGRVWCVTPGHEQY